MFEFNTDYIENLFPSSRPEFFLDVNVLNNFIKFPRTTWELCKIFSDSYSVENGEQF